MELPTLEQFFNVVKVYNLTIWPMQVVAYILGVLALILAIKKTKYSSRIISAILVFFWLWVGFIFSRIYFIKVFNMAGIYVVLLIIQGIIFLIFGVFRPNISFRFKPNVYSIIGIFFIIYAMICYPAIEYILGRGYPKILPFGLVPCPTIIFTFGLFLWTDKKLPKFILIIPLILAISGFLAIVLGIWEDIGLIIAGILGTIMIVIRDRRM